MKKLKNILLPVAMILVVVLSTSCGKGSDATKTFEERLSQLISQKEQNGIKTTVTFTYIEKEDKVIKQKNEVVGEYAKLPEKKTKEQVKSILDPIVKKYQGIKGIKYTVDYKDDRYIENIEIDFQNLDYEKAKTVFGNNFKDPSKTKISMKQTQERVTKQGFKERK